MYVGGIIFREMSFSSPRVIVPIHKLQLLLFEVRRLLGTRGIGKGGEDGPMSVKQPPPQGPHGCFSGVWNFPYAQPSCRQFPAGQVSVLFHFLIDRGAGRLGLQENFEKSS